MTSEADKVDESGDDEPAPVVWPQIVKLKNPIQFGTELVVELEFQKGRLGFLKGIPIDRVPTVDQLITIAARMCGKSTAVLERLSDEDSSEVLEIALSFFTRCLGT